MKIDAKAVRIATERAKADKAWYLKCVRHALEVEPIVARDLYNAGIIPPCFPVPAIPLSIEYDIHPAPYYVSIWREFECLKCFYKR